jgi:hypothetical protein
MDINEKETIGEIIKKANFAGYKAGYKSGFLAGIEHVRDDLSAIVCEIEEFIGEADPADFFDVIGKDDPDECEVDDKESWK